MIDFTNLDAQNSRDLYIHVFKNTGSEDRAKKAVNSYLEYFKVDNIQFNDESILKKVKLAQETKNKLKLSELIKVLEEVKIICGDLPVVFGDAIDGSETEYSGVSEYLGLITIEHK